VSDEKKRAVAFQRGGPQNNTDQVAGETYNEKISPRLAVAVVEKEAIAAIEYATAKHPCLCREGMVTNLFQPEEPYSICGVVTALAFLRQFPKRSQPLYRSDWLKDKAGEWGGECAVANGELIVAATFLGLPMKYDDGPNATIGVRLPPAHAVTRAMH
jgi:hypothetical protein